MRSIRVTAMRSRTLAIKTMEGELLQPRYAISSNVRSGKFLKTAFWIAATECRIKPQIRWGSSEGVGSKLCCSPKKVGANYLNSMAGMVIL